MTASVSLRLRQSASFKGWSFTALSHLQWLPHPASGTYISTFQSIHLATGYSTHLTTVPPSMPSSFHPVSWRSEQWLDQDFSLRDMPYFAILNAWICTFSPLGMVHEGHRPCSLRERASTRPIRVTMHFFTPHFLPGIPRKNLWIWEKLSRHGLLQPLKQECHQCVIFSQSREDYNI